MKISDVVEALQDAGFLSHRYRKTGRDKWSRREGFQVYDNGALVYHRSRHGRYMNDAKMLHKYADALTKAGYETQVKTQMVLVK